MRILIVTAAFPPMKSGGADYAFRMASELACEGHVVRVLTNSKANTKPLNGIESVEAKVELWDWNSIFECLNQIQRFQPDVVNIHFAGWTFKDHPAITFLSTVIKNFFPDLRVVTLIESLGGVLRERNSQGTNIARKLVSLWAGNANSSYDYGTLLRDSDWIITLSERDREALSAYLPNLLAKSEVLPPPAIMPVAQPMSGAEKQKARAKLGHPNASALIAFYGYKYPGKGLETLFEALAILKKRGSETRLHLIGDFPEDYVLERANQSNYKDSLARLASELEVTDLIVEHGYAASDSLEPSRLLRLADVAVLPFDDGLKSHNSSYWFVAKHGIPVVATRSLEPVPILESEPILFCEPRNPTALADSIEKACREQKQIDAGGAEQYHQSSTSKADWKSLVMRLSDALCRR